MQRPILIITLGFITGIILGLYLNIAPFVFLFLIFILLFVKTIKFDSRNNYIRIIRVFIKNNVILVFLISSFISSIYLNYCNKRYEIIYNNFIDEEIIATVVSNKKESEYMDIYKVRLEGYKGINLILRISSNKKSNLEYGDKIQVKGEYIIPDTARNYGGFNYMQYLKTQKVYGIFKADNIKVINSNNVSVVELLSNNFKQKIINDINKILPETTKNLFLGILIGYDEELTEEIQESFRRSSLTHLLAVSGSHVAYIIFGIKFLFKKLKIPNKIADIITIVFLIFFMYLTDLSSSVVRASIMGIILLISTILFKKNDIFNSISISVLIMLLENPYKILDIGLLLSYFATIGIIVFSKIRKENSKKEIGINIKKKVFEYIKELSGITIFANAFVIPIIVYNFNTISLTFVISNLIAGMLIGPITIGGFILIIILLISIKFAYIYSIPYNILLELLVQSTKFTSLLPLSEILIPTPNIFIIIIYYLLLFVSILYFFLKRRHSNRYLIKKIINLVSKYFNSIKKNLIYIFTCVFLIIIILSISKMIPKDLKIHFIDVGQGDSTLIVTPTNKKILIDSGGAETGEYDVGKSVLVPYLLDKKILSLDYICISHFDSDHCKGFIYLLKNIKVKNIILSKQFESTNNFEDIIEIAKEKKINILKVQEGNVLYIDKYVKFKIFSPENSLSNDINDNSIVMKLEYLNFSCLFTGDISKEIEKKLVKKYGDVLQADILKVAHHGSKSSSDESFIKTVNPRITLIGVGKNNKFGHPNQEVLNILKDIGSLVCRTDTDGEISITINRNGKIKTESFIK